MSTRRSTRRHADRRIEATSGSAGLSHPGASAAGIDGGLLLAAGVLIGVGVVMSYSSTAPLALSNQIPPLFLQHLVALLVGLSIATLAALTPIQLWYRIAIPLWLGALALLGATALFGT
jgi:cell division protein FtsW (lipid II flippase)